jgi:aspartokinase/homoserine dehydrogenase 1
VSAEPFVFKFGGSSLQTSELINEVLEIVTTCSHPLVVVTSAVKGITDLLVRLCEDPASINAARNELIDIHRQLAHELELPGSVLDQYEDHLQSTLTDLDLATGSMDGPKHDLVVSLGERLSTWLVAAALETRGARSAYIDSRSIIRTDRNWGSAHVDLESTRELVCQQLEPLLDAGLIPVVTGFAGSDEQGNTTTLGRDGSDLTATVMGYCLGAAEVWIWTDVDGIYTADPRYSNGARLLTEISYREAAEAAYFGTKVIHPHTFWPLLESNVSVRIKNTFNPTSPGTLICAEPKNRGSILITTSVEKVSVITIGGYGMVGVPGIATRIFGAVSDEGASVLMISQSSSEHNITFVVKDEEVPGTVNSLERALSEWIERDHVIDRIRVVPDVAIVTVVGENMRGRYGIAGKIFSALGNNRINVIAIAQGSSEYSISMVLKVTDMRQAVAAIHEELDVENSDN